MAKTPPTPTYPAYTNLALGDGLLDQLMKTVEFHVHKEFKAQRITGGDYATVYLGALESALANSTQYLLGVLLYEQQKEKIEAEIRLLDLESEKLRYEIDYMYPAQLIKLQQEGLLIEAQVKLAEAEIIKTEAEIRKIEAEILMLETQKELIAAQILKIDAEIDYINAKILTELANTTKNFTADSVIGRQTSLLQAQTLGFAGDLDVKISKLHADYQSVWVTTYEPDAESGSADLQGMATGTDADANASAVAKEIRALGS
jgi:hypothetical protein